MTHRTSGGTPPAGIGRTRVDIDDRPHRQPGATDPAGSSSSARRSRIVVGVDGSLPSVDALRWALREAGPLDATVEAVVAWDFPVTYGIEFGALDVDWAGNAAAALRDALRAAPRPAGRPVTAMVIRGRPVDVLVAAAADADLLVIGSQRRAARPGPPQGSIVRQVAARVRCPVVVVRRLLDAWSDRPSPSDGVAESEHLSAFIALTGHEQSVLDEIENGLAADDPAFAAMMSGDAGYAGPVAGGRRTCPAWLSSWWTRLRLR